VPSQPCPLQNKTSGNSLSLSQQENCSERLYQYYGIRDNNKTSHSNTRDKVLRHHNIIIVTKYIGHQIFIRKIDTTQNNNINIVHKRSTNQSLHLSLRMADEIKISIMFAWEDPPVSNIERSQIGSMSSKIIRIKS
jgi:hypothetical protein